MSQYSLFVSTSYRVGVRDVTFRNIGRGRLVSVGRGSKHRKLGKSLHLNSELIVWER